MKHLFQCHNEDCNLNGRTFIFESEVPICPQCEQGPPFITTVVRMHYAYYNKKGPIKGYAGRKISIACMPTINVPITPFQATTGYMKLVNCPQCKNSEIYKRMWVPDPNDMNSYFENPNLKKETTLEK